MSLGSRVPDAEPDTGYIATEARADMIVMGARPGSRQYLRSLWQRRDFALTLALGDLKNRNMDTALGSVWHLLNPLIAAAIYFVVFGVIFGARDDVENYTTFLIVGVFVFTYTRKSVTSGSSTIINNLKLIQSIYFPRAVLPLATIIAESLAHLPALAVMFLIALATGEAAQIAWLLVVPITLLQAAFNLGLALVTARATVHFRDVQQLLPFVTRLWFYLSAVLYTIDRIVDALGESWGRVFELNPVYAFIHLTRLAVVDGSTEGRFWLYGAVWTVLTLLVGGVYFLRHEMEYAHG